MTSERLTYMTAAERSMSSIQERVKFRCEVAEDGCWVWKGRVTRSGYAMFRIKALGHNYAHRVSYEAFVGPIPEGMQLDHLCRNRACVNPDHLEPVTPRENCLRGVSFAAVNAAKTHCAQGHEYNEVNTYTWVSGDRRRRICRPCHNARQRARYAQKQSVA